jgi:hypothetical protein
MASRRTKCSADVANRPSRPGYLNWFTWLLYGGVHKQVIRIAMKLINRVHKGFGWPFEFKCRASRDSFAVTCPQMDARVLVTALIL